MKQKRQLVILFVLVLIAAVVWFWTFQRNTPAVPGSAASSQDDPLPIDNPHIRFEEIDKARKAEYKSTGRNIFSEVALPTSPLHPHSDNQAPALMPNRCGIIGQAPCPPPPPEPPKLPPNVKYYGYGVVPNGTARRAFLYDATSDEVYVVSEGEVLLKRYRILRIGNTNLQFEDISSPGLPGSAPLEEQEGPTK